MKAGSFLVVAICLHFCASSAASTYFVGNSLTLDGLGHYSPEGLGFHRLAASAGIDLDYGFHLRCGSALPDTLANPTDVCVTSPFQYGRFYKALPSYQWDAVTIQPYLGTSLALDAAATKSFIELAQSHPGNSDTAFYLYSAWPALTVGKYSTYWEADLQEDDSLPSQQHRSYVDHLFTRVDKQNDVTLRLIPAGEVMYRLDKLIDAGELPGVTSINQFYRDDLHLSNLGKYIASATILAVTEREDPAQFVVPVSNYGEISTATLEVLHKTIWDVVASDPRTGIADFDDDGAIGASDLALWMTGNPRADANGDELVDGADFLIWQRQFDPASANLNPVPEPATSSLALLAMCLPGVWKAARRR